MSYAEAWGILNMVRDGVAGIPDDLVSWALELTGDLDYCHVLPA